MHKNGKERTTDANANHIVFSINGLKSIFVKVRRRALGFVFRQLRVVIGELSDELTEENVQIDDDLERDFALRRELLHDTTGVLRAGRVLRADHCGDRGSFSREQVMGVQSTPKKMNASDRADGDVKARISETR